MALPMLCSGTKHSTDQTGISKVSLTYNVDGPMGDADDPWDILYDFFPPTPPLGLVYMGRSAQKTEQGDWMLTLEYEGIPPGKEPKTGGGDQGQCELDHSSVDSPIETHPRFRAIAKKWRAKMPEGKFDGFEPTIKDPGTGATVKNKFLGVSHYLDGNTILRATFTLKQHDPSLLRNLLKIDRPRVPKGAENLTQTTGGQTWLKRSCKASFRGNVWQYTIEWMMGDWAPDLYSPSLA